MPAMDSRERPVAQAPGRLSRAFARMFMKHATVAACETIADRFRLITLEGPALEGAAWTPGQKIQIAMGSAFVARTYTPIEWDPVAGRTRILGYAHGDGPGSMWVRDLQPGDECDIFGPRRSLDVSAVAGPLALFGDETAIGLAHALLRQTKARAAACRFEVDDVGASRHVAAYLGLDDAALLARTKDDGHLDEMEAALSAPAAAGASFVLVGKAHTIQRLRQGLKRLAVPATRIVAKAYWAPGKAGLD
ncbi:siderophore-interacting protein [Labrys wisconsinensis]|uniref:NADPH-dependent ferric siderophore reductase n=1 Tax=Labrys wisconsinensis TaxID=425677 RepID=A0ABU0JNM9_9HYPH|nr:siderophore-interacting protein [Labrys wisconsinensis]MDQ0474752.1 NADPH-dependent ferric siderophore reductase [Labrys wisconsinensis]